MKELKMININNKESMIDEIMETACKTYAIYLKTCHKSNKLIGDFEIQHPKYSMDISAANQYKNENMRFYTLNSLLKVLFAIKEELTKMENQYTELLKKLFYERKNLYVIPGYNMTKKAFMQLAHRKTKNLVEESKKVVHFVKKDNLNSWLEDNKDYENKGFIENGFYTAIEKKSKINYQATLSLVIKRLYEVIKMDLKVKKELAEKEKTLKTRISNIFSVDTNEYPEVTITNWKNQRVYVNLKSKNHNHQLFINLINKNVICNSKCHSMYDIARYIDKYKEIVIDCAK